MNENKKNKKNNKGLLIAGIILSVVLFLVGLIYPGGSFIFVLGEIPLIIYIKKLFQSNENEKQELLSEINRLRSVFTPEMSNVDNLDKKRIALEKDIQILTANIDTINGQINQKQQELDEVSKKLIDVTDEAAMQDFGIYRPKYDFADSSIYKERLDAVRNNQKQLIKNGLAVTGNMNWTVNGSKAQGNKMVKDMQKLLLRAFNSDCDELIDKVKFNTFNTAVQRMEKSFDVISKCGSIMGVAITRQYYQLKYEELCLAHEYRIKKQEEKEEQKEIRARLREEAKLQKEIEEARKKIQKEQTHYSNALDRINEQIENASDEEKAALIEKKEEILRELQKIEKSIQDIDYREANAKAGYVYIISNIGSFGENVYKIGMTRRLDPMERIDELGDASVPFDFDVHAMIFSDNAPALETALHHAFDNRKVNMVNKRREFFNVTLEEIEAVVKKNYDKTVDFKCIPDAEQYRETKRIKSTA